MALALVSNRAVARAVQAGTQVVTSLCCIYRRWAMSVVRMFCMVPREGGRFIGMPFTLMVYVERNREEAGYC